MRHFLVLKFLTVPVASLPVCVSQPSLKTLVVTLACSSLRLPAALFRALVRTVDLAVVASPAKNCLFATALTVEDSITCVQPLQQQSWTECFLPWHTTNCFASNKEAPEAQVGA
jgi:hypothetical protein